jgi:RHS repeat-associated protein
VLSDPPAEIRKLFRNLFITSYDDLGRPTLTLEAAGTPRERTTSMQYSLQSRRVVVQKDRLAKTDGLLIAAQHYDFGGRVWRSRNVEDGLVASATGNTTSGILSDTQSYNSSSGHCTIASNPYRAAESATATTRGWTLTNLDGINRPTSTWNFEGAASMPSCGSLNTTLSTGHSSASYNTSFALPGGGYGVMTEVVDQAGKKRQMVNDGLGRLVLVKEDPDGLQYTTTYQYDVLDDLIGVIQGTQTRTFVYDSLRRLTSSSQPESAAFSYTYTDDGLVRERTNGNGVKTTYTYDAANRETGQTHTGPAGSALSAWITRCYDGKIAAQDGACSSPAAPFPLAHGRLTESRSNLAGEQVVSLTTYSQFDELGRALAYQQTTGGVTFGFRYSYDLAGGLTSQKNVTTNRTLSMAYNNLEQPTGLSGAVGAATPTVYAESAAYAAHGGLTSFGVGGNAWNESSAYNSRLQATNISGGGGLSLTFDYGGVANNGNVASQTIVRGANIRSHTYAYDGVNRLCAAAEATGSLSVSCAGVPTSGVNWSQGYGFDQYGNRWVSSSTGYATTPFTPVDSSNFDSHNRYTKPDRGYDAAGNQTQMGSGLAMEYDANGRMEASTLSGSKTVYIYDADGRRVLKRTGSATGTTYVYDAAGQLAMEVRPAGGTDPCTTCYLTADHLGSTRATVSAANAAVGCHDYLPFGEDLDGIGGRTGTCWNAGETTILFTGKERDSETVSSSLPGGLDYFGARYFSGAQGRFTSPDPVSGTALHLINPQRWNMYAYALNNPPFYTDPDGRDAVAVNLSKQVFLAGHMGIVSVHRDGTATYGREGPATEGRPIGTNEVKTVGLPSVEFGSGGVPTAASYRSLADAIGKIEGQEPGSINFAYFKTSEADTLALDNFLRMKKSASDRGSLFPYFGMGNNCADFCINGLSTARVLSSSQAANASTIPNILFWELSQSANSKKEKRGSD